jgi:pimeloyl-ACP methyl ester carboxylesterase
VNISADVRGDPDATERRTDDDAPPVLRVPEPHSVLTFRAADGALIRLRRHGRADAQIRLLISHGNGFAVDAYAPFWSRFLDDLDVVVYDQRNHGWNPRTHESHHDVAAFIGDLEGIITLLDKWLGPRPLVGVFHSISAITALAHAQQYPWRWHGLVVFDPPLIPSPGHPLHETARTFELGLADWALERPARFATPMEFGARLQHSRSRARWVPGAHQLMARSILREDPRAGEWTLACPPTYESRIYANNADLDLCPGLATLPGPLKFVCADPHDPGAWPPSQVNHALRATHGHACAVIGDTDHMLQIERPAECVREVLSLLDELSPSRP